MPPPLSLYQLPSPLFGSSPAAFHSRSSRALVPLLSPRETNGAAAPFVSRGDRSGTNALELRLWKAAGIDPKSGEGSWYKDIGGGMGQALNVAAAMPAYTLSDRGTWLSFKNKGKLRIVVEGDPALINRYDVIELNPQTHPNARLAPAHWLALWLTTQPGQEAIGAYRLGGEELFHPSAASPK